MDRVFFRLEKPGPSPVIWGHIGDTGPLNRDRSQTESPHLRAFLKRTTGLEPATFGLGSRSGVAETSRLGWFQAG